MNEESEEAEARRTKFCTGCDKLQDLGLFRPDSKTNDGLTQYCRSCRSCRGQGITPPAIRKRKKEGLKRCKHCQGTFLCPGDHWTADRRCLKKSREQWRANHANQKAKN